MKCFVCQERINEDQEYRTLFFHEDCASGIALPKGDGVCFFCHSYKNLHLHHIIPKTLGGTDDYDNLLTVCESCHKKIEYITKHVVFKRD